MRDWDEIIEEYAHRADAYGDFMDYAQQARDHVNGDIVVPLPEMGSNEKPAVANLIAHGLEHTAQRVASVLPNLVFPAMIPGKDKGTGSEDWANRRKMAVAGWWQESLLNLKMRRMARWIVGYGMAPIEIRPDFDTGLPKYCLRDPLGTYPALKAPYDDGPPSDVIYAYIRTAQWLKERHSEAYTRLFPKGSTSADRVKVLEYNDADDYVLGVLHMAPQTSGHGLWQPQQEPDRGGGVEIRRFPNRTGMCNSMVANRITFDRLMGQFHPIYGNYQNAAELMALEIIAIKKGIFPDIAITGTTPGRTPTLVNGDWHDGRSGKVNVVRDGQVDVIQLNPGFLTQPTIDRLERNMRVQGNVPAQWGGESPSNIATGQLGNQVLSATVDFPIQEYQEILSTTLREANRRAIGVAKAYFGNTKKVFHVAFGKAQGKAEYEPSKHFETDEHLVTYSAPGADVNALVIGGGQRIGIGGMSIQTWMEQDPMILDADMEHRRITSESLKRSLLTFVQSQVEQGAMHPLDVIILAEEVEAGATLGEAWRTAQTKAQERQAEEAAAQAAAAGPVDPGGQQGLGPGTPPEATPAIGEPAPSIGNLSQLLGGLRQPRAITSPLAGEQVPNSPVG